MSLFKKQEYYCDGICEICKYGKVLTDKQGEYISCDPKKIKGLKIISPIPKAYRNK